MDEEPSINRTITILWTYLCYGKSAAFVSKLYGIPEERLKGVANAVIQAIKDEEKNYEKGNEAGRHLDKAGEGND
jgi:NaMN:DMB phosphoribosyltransferase